MTQLGQKQSFGTASQIFSADGPRRPRSLTTVYSSTTPHQNKCPIPEMIYRPASMWVMSRP